MSSGSPFGLIVVVCMFGLLGYAIFHFMYVDPMPDREYAWTAAVGMYPGSGMDCHAAVAARIQGMADALMKSPHIDIGMGQGDSRQSAEMAVDMVANSGWRPPECG